MLELDTNQRRKPVRVAHVANPLQPVSSRDDWTVPYIGNGSIADYIPACVTVTPRTIVYQNGHIIPRARWGNRGVSPGDLIHIAQIPGATVFTLANLAWFGISLVASTGLSYLSSLLTDSPKAPDDIPSPTYGAAEILTQSANGMPIPIVYGEHIVGGNMIKATTGYLAGKSGQKGTFFVDSGAARTNLVLALSEGPVESIAGVSNNISEAWLNPRASQSRTLYGNLGTTPTNDAAITYNAFGLKTAFRFVVSGNTTEINSITLNLKRVGTIASGKKVSVWIDNNSGTSPAGVPTSEVMTYDATEIPQAYKRIRFAPQDPVALAPATYWVVIEGDWAVSATNHIVIGGQKVGVGSAALAGELKQYTGVNWVAYDTFPWTWLAVSEIVQHSRPWYSTPVDIKVNGTDIKDYLPEGQVSTRRGDLHQETLPGEEDVRSEQVLNHTLALYPNRYEETTEGEVEGVGVVFSFPSGVYHQGAGGITPGTFTAEIRVRANGNSNPWSKVYRVHRQIASAGPTLITARLNFPTDKNSELHALRGQIVDVEVIASYLPEQTAVWKSLREYASEQAQTYPHVALLQVEAGIGTAQGPLENITTRIQGKRMRVYDGSLWNYQYSANPADCCLDYLLNTRVGGGNVLTLANVDLDEWVEWRDYCATSISDGQGGQIARHLLGLVIDQPKPFWDWATTISAVGRAKLMWDGNKVRPKIERAVDDSDVAMVISAGNTVLGTYKRQWLGKKKRPNAVDLTYLDADNDFAESIASAEEPSLREAGEPDVREKMDFRGCTHQIHARRQARYLLNIIKYTDWLAEVEMFVEAMSAEPGDVVFISNDAVDADGIGGRLAENAPGATSIILDKDLTIEANKQYQITIRSIVSNADDTLTSSIIEGPGTYVAGTTLDISPSWTTTPQAGDVYTVRAYDPEDATVPSTEPGGERARIISWKTTDDGFVRLQLAQYDSRVYNDDPGNLDPAPPVPIIDGKVIPPRPENLALKPQYINGKLHLVATWNKASWNYGHECAVWLKDYDANGAGEFKEKGRTDGIYWAFDEVKEGFKYQVAITPLAPWTWQHHNPESDFAARRSFLIKRGYTEGRSASIGGLEF